MSSYFVNSFSGRYPNGPNYQLLNYGASSGAMNSGTYRDSSSATMHHATGSYGYSYNGMDLTVTSRGGEGNRAANAGGHFRGTSAVDGSRGFGCRQSVSCSLASPGHSLLTCSHQNNKLGTQKSPLPSEQPGSSNISSPKLSSASAAPGGVAQCFTELEDPSTDADDLLHSGEAGPGSNPRPNTGHSQTVQNQEGGPAGSAAGITGSDAQPPQIFPWMRKLHISHGTDSGS